MLIFLIHIITVQVQTKPIYGKMKPPRSTTTGPKTPQVHLKVVGVLPGGGRGSTIGPKTAIENGDFNHDSSHYTARMWRLCLHVTQQIACMLCQVDEEWAFRSFTLSATSALKLFKS